MTGTPSIVEFLTACLDNTEADAGQLHREDCSALSEWVGSSACDCGLPVFVLADIAAKRSIAARHTPHGMGGCGGRCEVGHGGLVCNHDGYRWPCPDVLDLAEPFSEHPDYRQEWRRNG